VQGNAEYSEHSGEAEKENRGCGHSRHHFAEFFRSKQLCYHYAGAHRSAEGERDEEH